jgi:hypothetical protein
VHTNESKQQIKMPTEMGVDSITALTNTRQKFSNLNLMIFCILQFNTLFFAIKQIPIARICTKYSRLSNEDVVIKTETLKTLFSTFASKYKTAIR